MMLYMEKEDSYSYQTDWSREEDLSEFNTSEIDWGEGSHHSWEEEDGHVNASGREETDSEISYGDKLEREEEESKSTSSWYEEETGQDDESWCNEIEEDEPERYKEEYELEDDLEETWENKTDSEISYKGELEEEDFNLEEEQDQFVEPYHEDKPWCEETKSHGENSWNHEAETEACFGVGSEREEENKPWCEIPYSDHEEEHQEETDSQYSQEEIAEEKEVESEAGRNDFREAYTEEDEDIIEETRYIKFAGHHQGPEAYLRWEQDMEYWLSSNNILEEEKTSYAEETLTEDAFKHWERDAYTRLEYEEPESSWEEMKQLLSKEFVEDADDMRQYNIRVYTNPEPRRWILATRPTPKAMQKKAFCPKPKNVSSSSLKEKTKANQPVRDKEMPPAPIQQVIDQKQSPSPLLEPHGEPKKCKSSKLNKSKEITCYRCHKKGHFAATSNKQCFDTTKTNCTGNN